MKKTVIIVVLLYCLILSNVAFSDSHFPDSPVVGMTATVAEVKDYFVNYIKNEMHIDIGTPDDYCISVSIIQKPVEVYSAIVFYYDYDLGTRNGIVGTMSLDLTAAIDTSHEHPIHIDVIEQYPYSKILWEKEKRLRHELENWLDITKNAPLWDYTQKYEFYQKEGGFIGDFWFIYDIAGVGIEVQTGSIVLPDKDAMQYDEALECAWRQFHKYCKDFTGNLNDIVISSVCVKKTPEAIQKAKMTNPNFADDGIQWHIQFFLPICLDNGETIYKLLLNAEAIMRNNVSTWKFFRKTVSMMLSQISEIRFLPCWN